MLTKREIKYETTYNAVVIFAILFILIVAVPTSAALSKYQENYPLSDVIQPEVRTLLNDTHADEKISVIVTLKEQVDLSRVSTIKNATPGQEVIFALQETADRSQKEILSLLNAYKRSAEVDNIIPFWIFNGFSLTTTSRVIQELAKNPAVLSISSDQIDLIPSSFEQGTTIQDNLFLINAPLLWDQGWMGQGVVVASMDTGVDLNHPDLKEKWRGGLNSWYDPFGKHDLPNDLNGHGTMTMGVILGGDASGSAIGVAPQAKWIAVKIFDDDGSSTATAVHLGFQWLLDPDNDPQTDDFPDVVNNSWSFSTPGCNTEFLLDIQTLFAAGILPIFSAGNFGPNVETSVSPANYPEAFAVGAVTNEDLILSLSSRGPSICEEVETIYPEITAPGFEIFTSDSNGFYTTATGTSLAAPHVSGSLALLLSAFPSLNIEDQKISLIENAVDLGEFGPDNVYGYGRVDVDGSYQAIYKSGLYPTATPEPTPIPPEPTPTDDPIPNFEPLKYYFPLIIGD